MWKILTIEASEPVLITLLCKLSRKFGHHNVSHNRIHHQICFPPRDHKILSTVSHVSCYFHYTVKMISVFLYNPAPTLDHWYEAISHRADGKWPIRCPGAWYREQWDSKLEMPVYQLCTLSRDNAPLTSISIYLKTLLISPFPKSVFQNNISSTT